MRIVWCFNCSLMMVGRLTDALIIFTPWHSLRSCFQWTFHRQLEDTARDVGSVPHVVKRSNFVAAHYWLRRALKKPYQHLPTCFEMFWISAVFIDQRYWMHEQMWSDVWQFEHSDLILEMKIPCGSFNMSISYRFLIYLSISQLIGQAKFRGLIGTMGKNPGFSYKPGVCLKNPCFTLELRLNSGFRSKPDKFLGFRRLGQQDFGERPNCLKIPRKMAQGRSRRGGLYMCTW